MTLRDILDAMLDAVVDGVQPLFRRFQAQGRLVAVEDGDGFRFLAVDRGRVSELSEGPVDERTARQLRRAGRRTVELRLDPGRLIARSLQLPAAGRDYLEPIIEHRLERLTPWRPDKVVYGFAVAGEAGVDGTMDVDFLATSQDIVNERVDRLAALQLAPTALGSAGEPVDRPLRVDLFRGTRDIGRRRLRRAVGFSLAMVALVLVPLVGASAWMAWDSEQRLAALETRLVTKRNVLRAATGDTEAESRDLRLMNDKRPETSATVLVDRLATLLPDNTFLRELEIDGASVRIAGFSTDASALIPTLEADESLSDVRFSAPVTRDETGRDGFDIVARWDARLPPADNAAPSAPADPDPMRTGALP
jgi:general secretion pathway protein L